MIFFEVLLFFVKFPSHGELVSVQILARHGDRGAEVNIPKLPYQYKLNELTPDGYLQHRNLGAMLFDHYSSFLHENYSDSNVYGRSSGITRCLQSLWSLFAGLYPNGNPEDHIQALPFQTTSTNLEFFFLGWALCKNVNSLQSDFLDNNAEYNQKLLDLNNTFSSLSEALNYTVDKSSYMDVLDALEVQHAHGYTDYDDYMTELFPAQLFFYDQYPHGKSEADFKTFSSASSGPLINQMFYVNMDADLSQANSTWDPATPKLLRVYLGHDISMLNTFSSFGTTIDFWPYYAAALIVELHRNRDGQGKPYIKFFYQKNEAEARKGNLWTPYVPAGCSEGAEDGSCDRDTFLRHYKSVAVPDVDDYVWRTTVCNYTSKAIPPVFPKGTVTKGTDDESAVNAMYRVIAIFAILTFAVLLLDIVICITICWRPRKKK